MSQLSADVDPRETLLARLRDSDAPGAARALYQHALDTLDFALVADIQRKHLGAGDTKGASPIRRSFDIGRFLRRAFVFCEELELVRSPPLTILDISCGPGYFGYAARFFGHQVINLDKPYDVYVDIHRWLGNDYVGDAIKPERLLPPTARCDLVTAFSAAFHVQKNNVLFTTDEWDFFFADLVTNHLKPSGRMFLLINQVEQATEMNVESPEFAEYIASRGGVMGEWHRIRFDDLKQVPAAWFKLAAESRATAGPGPGRNVSNGAAARFTERPAAGNELMELRLEVRTLKEIVAEQALELHRLKRDAAAASRSVSMTHGGTLGQTASRLAAQSNCDDDGMIA